MLTLLSLSLYHELHVLVTFVSIVKIEIDVQWRIYVSLGGKQSTIKLPSINANSTNNKSKKVISGIGLSTL